MDSPIIIGILQNLETKCLNKIGVQLIFYYRYVDDIILAAPSDKVDLIFKIFNYHDRLKFTLEREDNCSLSFLDLLLTISNNMIYVDWFYKETFSEWFLSFYSNHPLCHKIDIIYNLIDRAFLLSHPKFQQKNLEFTIELLLDNGYPLDLIFEKVNNRLKTLINKKVIILPEFFLTKKTILSTIENS